MAATWHWLLRARPGPGAPPQCRRPLRAVADRSGSRRLGRPCERDIAVLRHLIERNGRAEVEDVVSGRGLQPCTVSLFDGVRCRHRSGRSGAPAAPTTAALERRCAGCVEALEIFVEAYGAEAGNAALRSVATAGVFIGGGSRPRSCRPSLTAGF